MPTTSVFIRSRSGLHARPAAEVVKEASQYKCDIVFSANGRQADAKSIFEVLALGLRFGDCLAMTAQGEGATLALERLQSLLEQLLDQQ